MTSVQRLLNPSTASKKPPSSIWHPEGPIPPKVRKFGFCIDFADLLPGDLILVSSVVPDFVGKLIRQVQEDGGYGKRHCRWEHAAIYIEDGVICEATRKGVHLSSIYTYMGSHLVRVRRNPLLTTDQRWRLVVSALKKTNYRYGYMSVIDLYFKSLKGFWSNNGKASMTYPKRARYCSELYVEAHTHTCGIYIGNAQGGESTPAHLSLDTTLSDVKIKWIAISK